MSKSISVHLLEQMNSRNCQLDEHSLDVGQLAANHKYISFLDQIWPFRSNYVFCI